MRISRTTIALTLGGVVLSLIAVTPAARAENIVENGDFDSGLTDWSTSSNDTGPPYWTVVSSTTDQDPNGPDSQTMDPNPGSTYFATTGCNRNDFCNLAQDLDTVAGATYDISFAFNAGYFINGQYPDTDDLVAEFGSSELFNLSNGAPGWVDLTVDGVLATDSVTTIEFAGYQNPAHMGVDAVSVTLDTLPTPEPRTPALFGLGILMVVALKKAKHAKSISSN
jgi:hypothetical protein